MNGLDSLIAEFQAFAESVGHQQSEDPAEGMVATESCVHCQLILLFIPKLEVYAAAERALREKLEGLRELSRNATQGEWVRSKHCFQILTADAMNSVTELTCPRGLATHPPDDRVERWLEDVKFIVACVNYVRDQLKGS